MRSLFLASLFLVLPVQAHAGDLTFAIAADAGKIHVNSAAARASMERAGVFELILPGDNLYAGTYDAVWNPWSADGFHYAVTAIGNHNAGYAAEMRFFQMPGEYFTKTYADTARFIVLNSDNTSSASAQASFLDHELAAATEPFVFIVYHHPTYTLSHFHNWEEKKAFQLAIRPVLTRHRSKITALLVGHDHLAMVAHFGDLPVIVSGAIWETRGDSPINNIQDGVKVATNWYYDGQPHWAKLSLDTQADRATVEFTNSKTDQVSCTAHVATGARAELESDCR